MAAVVKFANRRLVNKILYRINSSNVCLRHMSESSCKSTKDTLQAPKDVKCSKEFIPDFSKPLDNKNWVSYGFDYEDQKKDTFEAHNTVFVFVYLFSALIFFFMYLPDPDEKDWALREAYIRLRERELAGLEPIDPNYIDPEKIVLPSDEELGDFKLVL